MSRADVWRGMYDTAVSQGWSITITGKGHLCWRPPSGGAIYSPSTPSDSRGFRNVRAQLRRAGLKI